jgi:hypothetical protein
MRRIFYFSTLFATVFLLSCSTLKKNVTTGNLSDVPDKGKILIIPFENTTQTPYAGVKAAALTEGVLRSYGYNVIRGYKFDDENGKIILNNVEDYDYILTGKVIEWRYKTGIDGEPAVSLYIEIKDRNNNIIWSAAGSKSQWGHKSVSLTAQELLNEIFKPSKK